MSLSDFMTRFREMHAQARAGKLPAGERELYLEWRDQLASALLSAQRMALREGETPRRMLRVPRALQVDLELPATGRYRTPTIDISAGGFAVFTATGTAPSEAIEVQLRLPGGGEVVKATARPLQAKPQGALTRVSFTFVEINESDVERIEMVVFDTALEMIRV